jgi:hypothetical protein
MEQPSKTTIDRFEGCSIAAEREGSMSREFMKSPPQFKVSAPPIDAEEAQISVNNVCAYLLDISLDDMRTALQTRGHASGLSRLKGPLQMEVHMIQKPLNLGVIIGSHLSSHLVRLRPADFDRSDPEQDALYQKCIGILEILSTARVGKTYKRIAVSALKFRFNESESERLAWVKLLRRWNRKKSAPPT